MKKQICALVAVGVVSLVAFGATYVYAHPRDIKPSDDEIRNILMDAIDDYIAENDITVGHDGCEEVSYDDGVLVVADDEGHSFKAIMDEDEDVTVFNLSDGEDDFSDDESS